jgi:hypothetical protein
VYWEGYDYDVNRGINVNPPSAQDHPARLRLNRTERDVQVWRQNRRHRTHRQANCHRTRQLNAERDTLRTLRFYQRAATSRGEMNQSNPESTPEDRDPAQTYGYGAPTPPFSPGPPTDPGGRHTAPSYQQPFPAPPPQAIRPDFLPSRHAGQQFGQQYGQYGADPNVVPSADKFKLRLWTMLFTILGVVAIILAGGAVRRGDCPCTRDSHHHGLIGIIRRQPRLTADMWTGLRPLPAAVRHCQSSKPVFNLAVPWQSPPVN